MSSHRKRRALQRQPTEGEPLNAEEDAEVVEGVGSGDDLFMNDVDEPLSDVRTDAAATPSGEGLFPLACNCKFQCVQKFAIDKY